MSRLRYYNINKTIIYYNSDTELYIKSSYDKNSIISLTNEYEGFKWYFSKKPSLDKSLGSKLKKGLITILLKLRYLHYQKFG